MNYIAPSTMKSRSLLHIPDEHKIRLTGLFDEDMFAGSSVEIPTASTHVVIPWDTLCWIQVGTEEFVVKFEDSFHLHGVARYIPIDETIAKMLYDRISDKANGLRRAERDYQFRGFLRNLYERSDLALSDQVRLWSSRRWKLKKLLRDLLLPEE